MIRLLSQILFQLGLTTYLERVEFAAHLGWSIAASLSGLFISKWIIPIWIAYMVFDEFVIDGFKGTDTYIDLGSKCLIPLIIGVICFLK